MTSHLGFCSVTEEEAKASLLDGFWGYPKDQLSVFYSTCLMLSSVNIDSRTNLLPQAHPCYKKSEGCRAQGDAVEREWVFLHMACQLVKKVFST